MRVRLVVAALCSFPAFFLPAPVGAAELGVVAPVVVDGRPLMKRDGQNRSVPVVTRVASGPLYEKLQKEARDGFVGTVLALDDLAQRRAGSAPVPTWLYLAVEDGGFARSGFWLREAQGERFVPDAYVDLVVDVSSPSSLRLASRWRSYASRR